MTCQQLDLLNQELELFCPPAHGCAGPHAWQPMTIEAGPGSSFIRCSHPAPLPWQQDRTCRCSQDCPCHN